MNTMAFGESAFEFRRQALITALAPLDFTFETSCAGFDINGTEPENTRRRVMFKIDDKLHRFGNSGLVEYTGRGDIGDVLENGNTVAELLALNDVPEFVGKMVFPVIALDAPADSPVFPKIKIAAKVNSFNDIFTRYYFSPIYDLTDTAKIREVAATISTNGNGTATCYCRIFNNGWGDWLYLADAANKRAQKIQFKVHFVLSTIDGSDSADVQNIRCLYSTDENLSAGNFFEIVSLPQTYPLPLKTCYALIKHSELLDAKISAFVNYSDPPTVKSVVLGTGDGTEQTFTLEGANIQADSLHVEADGVPVSGFYFDTGAGTLTIKNTGEISATYLCNDAENWLAMELDETKTNSSRFVLNAEGKTVAAVKFVVEKLSGSGNFDFIGTGKLQTLALPHAATALQVGAPFSYEPPILQTVAQIGQTVSVSYVWAGSFPHVSAYAAGFSV